LCDILISLACEKSVHAYGNIYIRFFLLKIPHIYLIGSGCLNAFYIAWSFTAIKSVPAQVDYHTLRFQGTDINILCLG